MVWGLIVDDFRANRTLPVRLVLLSYRLTHVVLRFGNRCPVAIRWLVRLATFPMFVVHRLLSHQYGAFIPPSADIGRRLLLPHGFYGVFISTTAIIGDDVTMLQHVTLGSNYQGRRNLGAPRIGNRVMLGAGAVLIGGITVGDDARVGANATVVQDVPPGATAVSAQLRIIPPREPASDMPPKEASGETRSHGCGQ
jgi:serine O-acetyltransferase